MLRTEEVYENEWIEVRPVYQAMDGSEIRTQTPPEKGMVWVNTSTKVFHREGDEWYGKTKHGKFMNEQDAVKAGYRLSREKLKKQ